MPTLEHFFNYYVHMKKASEMPREIDIHFFRDDRVPMWEVSLIPAIELNILLKLDFFCLQESPEGGVVILKIKKDDNVDRMWESLLFAMIGKCLSLINCYSWQLFSQDQSTKLTSVIR